MANPDDFPKRPDTRSFHWASTFQVGANQTTLEFTIKFNMQGNQLRALTLYSRRRRTAPKHCLLYLPKHERDPPRSGHVT